MESSSGHSSDVDIIFVGGGTAACVAAARLAMSDRDLKILVIEGGRNNFEDPTVTNPALFGAHLIPTSTSALFYKSRSSACLGGREVLVPAGGILGGGSSINLSMYTRAQAADYDSWKTLGWAAKDMITLCNKTETFDSAISAQDSHGSEGPVHISDGGFRSCSGNDFLKTIKEMGMNEVADINDFGRSYGFSKIPRYVSKSGKRQDAAHCYLHPLLQDGKHPNLKIAVESKVVRVTFDNSNPPRANGVVCKAFVDGQLSIISTTVKAARLVILAAGALGTPQILERSGIGNSAILSKHGIPVRSHLPGVGENYQDHHFLSSSFKTSLQPSETLDSLVAGRKNVGKAIAEKDPQLGWNSIDIAGKLRPSDTEARALGPDFVKDWERDFAPYPDRPMMIMNVINTWPGDPSVVKPGQYVTLGSITLYPYSRGSIHVTSPSDPINGYDFDAGFLSHPSDIKKQVWAYKKAREIARRLPFVTHEIECPDFAKESSAAVFRPDANSKSNINGTTTFGDIVYSVEDDAVIEQWIRTKLSTTWHSLGTCAMRPQSQGGVVDANLNVYGVAGLKVADLSIVPENIGANVGNTAFAVGEKTAMIVVDELGPRHSH